MAQILKIGKIGTENINVYSNIQCSAVQLVDSVAFIDTECKHRCDKVQLKVQLIFYELLFINYIIAGAVNQYSLKYQRHMSILQSFSF